MRCLFIGGYADGEWRGVDADAHIWRVAELPSARSDVPFSSDPTPHLMLTEHYYVRRIWRDETSHRMHILYLHSELDPTHLFSMLIDGYRRTETGNKERVQ